MQRLWLKMFFLLHQCKLCVFGEVFDLKCYVIQRDFDGLLTGFHNSSNLLAKYHRKRKRTVEKCTAVQCWTEFSDDDGRQLFRKCVCNSCCGCGHEGKTSRSHGVYLLSGWPARSVWFHCVLCHKVCFAWTGRSASDGGLLICKNLFLACSSITGWLTDLDCLSPFICWSEVI